MSESKQSIGAFWLRESKGGTKYMSGVIEIDGANYDIVVFKNSYKKEDKHPDYRIYLSDKQGGRPKQDDGTVPF